MSNTPEAKVRQRRDRQLNVPMTTDELMRIHALAEARCLPMATMVRMMLLGSRMSDPV
jgi:hypothetical protein